LKRCDPDLVIDELLETDLVRVSVAEPLARLKLTRRERDVLPLLIRGQTDREIAATLYISPRTSSAHVSGILRKLGAITRGEAAVLAVRLGLR
jgi:DNA-binding CsgD family transcriptional regulator